MRPLAQPAGLWGLAVTVAGVVLVAALLAAGSRSPDDGLRRDALAVAEAQVLDLVAIDTDSFEPALDRLRARAVGTANTKLSASAEPFAQAVRASRVDTTEARVDSAGVASFSATSATVLVASSAQVAIDGGEPSTSYYRVAVSLTRVDDTWKVKDMEFVS